MIKIKVPGNKDIICGIIYDKFGNILMGRRKKGMENGGKWEFPGGKLEAGESYEECLTREWKEEFNLPIEINKYLTANIEEGLTCHFMVGKLVYDNIFDFEFNAHDQIGLFNPQEVGLLNLFENDRILLRLI